MKNWMIFFLIGGILSLMGCSPEPGLGGNAAIVGKLKVENYNDDFSILYNSNYVADDYVYITYGGDYGYESRARTSYDGSFEFKYLKPGTYTLFAYSDDTSMTDPSGTVAVIREVEIEGNRDIIEMEDIVVADVKSVGNATVSGYIQVSDDGTLYDAQDERIYIVFEGEPIYSDDVKTNPYGQYRFEDVPVGNHKLYIYSKDDDAPSGESALEFDITIDTINQNLVAPDILIYK